MATTVLAVDDSVTMRKVLEITFAGSDFHVVTASSGDAAVQAVQQHKPAIALVDATLEPSDGYEVCRQIKAASPSTAVVILSSKQNPYNTGSGSAAGADDHIDKPYDTQQVLDKVNRVLAGGGAQPAAAAPAPAARPAAAAAAAPAPAARPAAAAPANIPSSGAPRAKTLLYSPDAVPPALAAARAGQPPPAAAPAARPAPAAAPAPAAHAPAAAAAVAPAISAAVNGHLQQKLGDLQLTPAQIDAVAALSKEIVERVVWEVVPVLAETLIKEEIARLTR